MSIKSTKGFYKTLAVLALPIALQNLLSFSVNLCGNIMVGSLGDAATSGVFAGSQMQIILQVFTMGIEGAILILSAQYWGGGDTSAIRKILSIGLRAAIIAGALLTLICSLFPSLVISLFTSEAAVIESGTDYLRISALSYIPFAVTQVMIGAMRSVERPSVGLFISLASVVLNFTLSYVLIFGRLGLSALGVRGAAVALLAARLLEMLLSSVYVLTAERRLGFRPRDIFLLDKGLLHDFIKYGVPVLLGQLLWAVNTLFASALIGRSSGEGALTAMSVSGVVNGIAYIAPSALASALGIITGKGIGGGEREQVKKNARVVQPILLALGALTFSAVRLIKAPLLSLYDISSGARAAAESFINVLSVTLVGTCYQLPCLFGLVKGGGESSFIFRLDCIFILAIVIPSALITSMLGYPAWVVFACLKCDQLLKCLVTVVKINRFDWMKNLRRGGKSAQKSRTL